MTDAEFRSKVQSARENGLATLAVIRGKIAQHEIDAKAARTALEWCERDLAAARDRERIVLKLLSQLGE